MTVTNFLVLMQNVQARNTEKFDFHEENMLMLSDSETETRRSILLSRVYKIKSGQASRYPAKNIIEEIQSCH